MGILDSYRIDLLSSKLQGTSLEWQIDDNFFSAIDGLIKRGNVRTKVDCVSAGSVFKFLIYSVGDVIVPCDRCLADLELRIETTDELTVKLGTTYADEGDCVIVPEAEGFIDLAQYIYEFIALSMPITCTHEPGKCDEAMMRELSKHQAATRSRLEDVESEDLNDGEGSIDERWAKLKDLKFNN